MQRATQAGGVAAHGVPLQPRGTGWYVRTEFTHQVAVHGVPFQWREGQHVCMCVCVCECVSVCVCVCVWLKEGGVGPADRRIHGSTASAGRYFLPPPPPPPAGRPGHGPPNRGMTILRWLVTRPACRCSEPRRRAALPHTARPSNREGQGAERGVAW